MCRAAGWLPATFARSWYGSESSDPRPEMPPSAAAEAAEVLQASSTLRLTAIKVREVTCTRGQLTYRPMADDVARGGIGSHTGLAPSTCTPPRGTSAER
eukprot:2502675-Prymnesium_polylepis.1